MDIRFDTYYNFSEITSRIDWLQKQYPHILEIVEVGKSYEGRSIPLIIVSNKNKSCHKNKPAFWIDGNIHSIEITSSAMVLYFIHRCTKEYGQNKFITELIDNLTFYCVPCINPDGMTRALAEKPAFYRSGVRKYGEDGNYLYVEDINDDGRILQMRIEDPTGDWKVSPKNPNFMIKRTPTDFESAGPFYRLFAEGTVPEYDGCNIPSIFPHQLDFNRNFPIKWRPEGEQQGAGDFAGSEVEIQNIVRFIAEHPNIFVAITYHTYSRVFIRAFSDRPDSDMNTSDLWIFEALEDIASDTTKYPTVSGYHDFKYHPKEIISGAFDDWAYEHRGIFTFTVELWDLPTAAGISEKNDEKNFIDWFRRHPITDDDKILSFIEKNAPHTLVNWEKFDHPQLGEIEIGGLEHLFSWRNPPQNLLEDELAPHFDCIMQMASLAPKLEIYNHKISLLGDGLYKFEVILQNSGYFSTYVSHQAKNMHITKPIYIDIVLPENATLLSGQKRVEIGHLEGRSNKNSMTYYHSPTDNRKKIEWIIRTVNEDKVTITATSCKAGNIEQSFFLHKGHDHVSKDT
ncbi:M14 family metallopeptidase [Candidatus Uabimicrobium sp. HlEnr_7]|uniref:M14 family metallopeptidase n=1 Tax=Candidatus Uabimicrobium helgolandensis TaxID=3095367 RepID=UPI0035588286